MKSDDQLAFVRLFFLLASLLAPFVLDHSPNKCQTCRHEAAARSNPLSRGSSETLQSYSPKTSKTDLAE